jgi:hypothetical protein
MEEVIKKYSVKGKIHFWEFKDKNPNRRNWNFTADSEGCTSFIELLELMNCSLYSSKKLVTLSPPEQSQIDVPNDRNIYWRPKLKLNLNYRNNESSLWIIKEDSDILEISFGTDKVREFIDAVSQVKENKGDFSIGDNNDNHILYFWWYR